jgi:hypothetical protein
LLIVVGIEVLHAYPVQPRSAPTKDDEDDDVFDGSGPSSGRPFLERLLLSLIDAHPRKQVQNPEDVLHDR